MAKDAPDFLNASQCAEEPKPQEEPSTYRVVEQVTRSEVRRCLAKMGFDVRKLETEDAD